MTRPGQKTAERGIAERLLSAIGLTAKINPNGERPDITLEVPRRKIGLEVTNYQSDKTIDVDGKRKFPQREIEAAWERFESASRSFRLERANFKNIAVIFW